MFIVTKQTFIRRRTVHIEKLVKASLKIKDHKVISCTLDSTLRITFAASQRRSLPCSICGRRAHRHDRLKEREWKHVPLWGFPVTFIYRAWRVRCPQCGIRREALPWAIGKEHLTRAFVVTLTMWAKLLPIETVATLFAVSWNTVSAAVRAAVNDGLSKRALGTIVHIGIDEISRRKGHTYMTQVYDLDTKRLLWSGEGRAEETLGSFLLAHPQLAETVQAVCCDMWDPYVAAVGKYLPNADIVYDKFHIIRQLLHAVNQVRVEEVQDLRKSHPEILRNTRYVILKNEENLTDKQQVRLKDLQRQKLKSTRAWLLKEAFREFWRCETEAEARGILLQWCWMGAHSRLEPIKRVVRLIRRHWDGILAYFRHRISNGVVEALNNTAKAISHRARGYRSAKGFANVMLLCMGGLELPQVHHRFL